MSVMSHVFGLTVQVDSAQGQARLASIGATIERLGRVAPQSSAGIRSLAASIDSLGRSAYSVARTGMYMMIGQLTALTYGLQKVAREFINVNQRFAQLEITLASSLKSVKAARDITSEIAVITARSPLPFQSIARAVQSFAVIPQVSGNLRQQAVQGTLSDPNGFLRKAVRLVEQMSAFRPDQGPEGAVFALRELLGGQSRSLVRRFDIPLRLVTQTKAAEGKGFAELKDAPDKLFAAVQEAFGKIISPQAILQFARQPSVVFANFIEQVFELVLLKIGQGGIYDKILTIFNNLFDQTVSSMKKIFEGGFIQKVSDILSVGFDNMLGVVKEIFKDLMDTFNIGSESSEPIERFAEAIVRLAKYASEALPRFVREAYIFIKQFGPVLMDLINLMKGLANTFIWVANKIGPLTALIGAFLAKNLITNLTQTLGGFKAFSEGVANFGKQVRGSANLISGAYVEVEKARKEFAAYRPITQASYAASKGLTPVAGGRWADASGRTISDGRFQQYLRQAQSAQVQPRLMTMTEKEIREGYIKNQRFQAAQQAGAGIAGGIASRGLVAGAGSFIGSVALGAATSLAIGALIAVLVKLGPVLWDWLDKSKEVNELIERSAEEWSKVTEAGAARLASMGVKDPVAPDQLLGYTELTKKFLAGRDDAAVFDEVNSGNNTTLLRLAAKLGINSGTLESKKDYTMGRMASERQGYFIAASMTKTPAQMEYEAHLAFGEDYAKYVKDFTGTLRQEVLNKLNGLSEEQRMKILQTIAQEDFTASVQAIENYAKSWGDLGEYVLKVLRQEAEAKQLEIQAAVEEKMGISSMRATLEAQGKVVTSPFYEESHAYISKFADKKDPVRDIYERYSEFVQDTLADAQKQVIAYIDEAGLTTKALDLTNVANIQQGFNEIMAATEAAMKSADLKPEARARLEKLRAEALEMRSKAPEELSKNLKGILEAVHDTLYNSVPFETTFSSIVQMLEAMDEIDNFSAKQIDANVKKLQELAAKMHLGGDVATQIDSLRDTLPNKADSAISRAAKEVEFTQASSQIVEAMKKELESRIDAAKATDEEKKLLEDVNSVLEYFKGKVEDAAESLQKLKADERNTELIKALERGPWSKESVVAGMTPGMDPSASRDDIAEMVARERLTSKRSPQARQAELELRREQLEAIRGSVQAGGEQEKILKDRIKALEDELAIEQKVLEIEQSRKGVMIGIRNGIESQMMTYKEMAESASSAFASGLGDAFGDFITGAKSAKEAFKDFAVSTLSYIAKMLIQQALLNAVMSIGGFSSGGAVPAASGSSTMFSGATMRAAQGGMIRGGSGTKDDVPILAMGGEYIIKKSRVQQLGVPFLDYLNSENFNVKVSRSDRMQRFANGGLVGGMPSSRPAMSPMSVQSVVNVTVNNYGDGKATSKSDSDGTDQAKGIARQVEALVLSVIRKEKRYGGELYMGN